LLRIIYQPFGCNVFRAPDRHFELLQRLLYGFDYFASFFESLLELSCSDSDEPSFSNFGSERDRSFSAPCM
jgi:hypothetical protein